MKLATYSGHFIFLIHAVLVTCFVFERSLYADSAYFLFNIINTETFFVGAERYASVLPQILTIAAVKMELPLKIVLYVFSISYIVFFYAIFNWVVYGLKNSFAGMIIALSIFFCTEHNYFMSIHEMTQAIVWSIALYAFMNYYYTHKSFSKWAFTTVSLLLVLLCFLNHPAAVFSIVFVVVFVVIDKKIYADITPWILLLVIAIAIVSKSYFIEKDSYEGGFILSFQSIKGLIKDFPYLYSTRFFFSRFTTLFTFPFAIGVLMTYWYYKKKDFIKLVLLVITSLSFIVISNIIFHAGDSDMMMERIYLQLSVFLLIPFAHDFLVENFNLKFVKIFLVVLVLISTLRVVNRGLLYGERVEYIASLISTQKNNPQTKFLVEKESLNESLILVPWAFAIETLIYSSLESVSESKTFYLVDSLDTFEYEKDRKSLFLAVNFWQNWDINSLNSTYFKISEQTYLPLK